MIPRKLGVYGRGEVPCHVQRRPAQRGGGQNGRREARRARNFQTLIQVYFGRGVSREEP